MRQFQRLLPAIAGCVVLALFAAPPTTTAPPSIDPARVLNHIKYLASPEMRGRATGSPELEKAAEYIAHEFKTIGLAPVDGKSYFQAFPVTTDAKLGRDNRFEYTEGGKTFHLKGGEDFLPFNFSSRGKVAARVVFAGYGITAPEYNYDDYQGVDVKGKLVIVLRHEPQEFDEHSVFDGKVYTEHSQFSSKATNAKNHGARGVILVNDTFNHHGESDSLEKFGRTVGPGDAGIPFVQVKEEVAARWISDAGKNLDDIGAEIDKDLKPQSFALPDSIEVREDVDVERVVKTVHNVAGYLPGETSEYTIIGAHYDHLGLGEQFSMAPSLAGTVHPGADDNASGTAGVIELARWFAGQPKQKRGILFLTFAGEELGLLGSSYYVNHPDLPLDHAVAMINLDMIGRVREGKVYVGGVGDRQQPAGNARTASRALPAAHRFFGYHGVRIERSHLVHHQAGARTVFLFGIARRLSQAERYLGQDRRPRYGKIAGPDRRSGNAALPGSRAAAIRPRQGARKSARGSHGRLRRVGVRPGVR